MLVRHFVFDSIDDYVTYLEEAPVHEAFSRACSSINGSEEFTGTRDLEEALHLCRFGWHEGFGNLVNMVERIKRALNLKVSADRTYHDYVGYVPDVGAYLEGSPLSMLNKPPEHKPHITLYMNTSYEGSEKTERILNRGAAVIAAAEALEVQGYLVDLKIFEMSYVDKDVHLSEFTLKSPDERVNPQRLYFPLCNPSWVRRLNFRLLEKSPDMTEEWAGCYGIPAKANMVRQIMGLSDEDILIPTIEEAGVEGVDVIADAQRIFDAINPLIPEDKRLIVRRNT